MKQKGSAAQIRKVVAPLLAAVITTSAAALLLAYLMQINFVPVETDRIAAWIAIALGGCAAGAFSGGKGKRGIASGVIFSLIWCLWSLLFDPDSFFMLNTTLEIGLCILCSWLVSCTFHKKKKKYTKRNRNIRLSQ